MGVTLYYEKAWWDNDAKAWVDAKFHILDNVQILGQGRARAPPPPRADRPLPLVVQVERGRLQELPGRQPQAPRPGHLLPPEELDREAHVPLPRQAVLPPGPLGVRPGRVRLPARRASAARYDTGQIKAKLQPGIEELEAEGFLEPLPREERYTKAGRGLWKIVLVQARKAAGRGGPLPRPARGGRAHRARRRAASARRDAGTAGDLVRDHPADRIRQKLEVFDWLVAKKDKGVTRSPSGFLVKSIQNDYAPPAGFESKADRQRKAEAAARAARQAEEAKRKAEQDEKAREEAENRRLTDYWEGLSAEDRERVWAEALAAASPFIAGRYRHYEHRTPSRRPSTGGPSSASYLEKQRREIQSPKKPR